MVNKAQARVRLGVDEEELNKGLAEAAKRVGDWGVRINQSLELAQKAWGFVTGAIGSATDAVKEWVKLADIQEKAEVQLLAAARRRGKFTQEDFDKLQASNAARQQALGIGDEEQLQLQKKLSALGINNKQLDEATKYTYGLAEATGSVESAAKLVAKALTGKTDALAKYNVKAKDVAEAQRKLNELFKIAEAKGQLLSTRITVLKANWGDFLELLGFNVTKSGALKGTIDALSTAVLKLQTYFASEAGRKAVNAFFAEIAEGGALAIDAVVGATKAFHQLEVETAVMAFRVKETLDQIFSGRFLTEDRDTFMFALDQSEQFLRKRLGDANNLLQDLTDVSDELRKAAKRGVENINIPQGSGGGGENTGDEEKGSKPTGKIGRSKLTETFTAPELGIFNIDVLKANEEEYLKLREDLLIKEKDFGKSRFEIKLEEFQSLRAIQEEEARIHQENLDLSKQYHIDLQQLEQAHTQKEVDALVQSAKKRREIFDVTLGLIQTSAELTTTAVRAGIDALVEAAITGQKFSSKAFASIIADMMIQQGWAFQSQAIAYTFEAIANYGSTAWRAAAMGSAAKTMLIAGYALKAKYGGGGGSAPAPPSGSRGGGGGRGAGGGVGSLPSTRPTSSERDQRQPAIVYNINVNGVVTDGRRVAQDIRRVLREGGATQPGGRRTG